MNGYRHLLCAAAALALLPGPAAGAPSRSELEERVIALERAVDNQGLIEIARQIERLQAELRALRGEIEQLQFAQDGAKQQQRDQYLDLDRRIAALEDGARRIAAAVPAEADPALAYKAAFDELKAGRYAEAKQGFAAFLEAHPEHELAENAQYWLGEVHYVELDYAAALDAFQRVIEGYPQARKAPDALLKAGYCQYELKRFEAARASLSRVIREYPGSPAAKDAGERLARMTAEGR